MREDTRDVKHGYNPFREVIFIVGVFLFLLVSGIVVYAVYLVRAYIPYVGYIWLFCAAILPTLGIVIAIVWTLRYILRADIIELGPNGNILRWFNQVTLYHPLGIQEYKSQATHKEKEETTELAAIPLLFDLIKDNVLGLGHLLLGYTLEGDELWGTWNDVKTFAIAGKSRSGKTVTMAFFIIQALLNGAVIYICDPHHNKKSGLLKVLEPLVPFMTVARKKDEILSLVKQYKCEMLHRENGTPEITLPSGDLRPILLVIDEWSKLLRDLENEQVIMLVDTILATAEEYADFQGYAMIAGQEWTARESGGKKGASIRRSFHAVYVHRLDTAYAKFLLTGASGQRKVLNSTPNLKTGTAYYQNTEGDVQLVRIPYYGDNREGIIEAANQLLALPSPEETPLLGPVTDSKQQIDAKQPVYAQLNRPLEQVQALITSVYEVPTPNEQDTEGVPFIPSDINGYDLPTLIKRMRKEKVPHRVISKAVGLYGPKYEQYQALCRENGIPLEA